MNTAKRNIYICNTPYHLLIATLKQLNLNNNSDIWIVNPENFEKEWLLKLKSTKIFENTFVFQMKDIFKNPTIIQSLIHKKNIIDDVYKKLQVKKSYFDNSEIFLFNDREVFGEFFALENRKYHLLEDSYDYFKNTNFNEIIYSNLSPFEKIQYFIIQRLKKNLYLPGKSPLVIDIEVNDKSELQFSNLKELNRKKLFNDLSIEQKQIILNIFSIDKCIKNWPKSNISILFTQPFSEDNVIEQKTEINIYKKLIANYFNKKDQLIIKVHPRDRNKYEDIFPNAIISYHKFPAELLNLTNLKINSAISVCSSSVKQLNNAQHIIYKGWNWVYSFNKNR